MIRTLGKFVITGLMILAITGLAGCQCMNAEQKTQTRKPSPPPKDSRCIDGAQGDEMSVAKAFPTGNKNTSVIEIQKVSPDTVVAGSEFSYDIMVLNLTDMAVNNVVVTEQYSDNFTFEASSPQAEMTGDTASWQLGTMTPQETRTITVKGMVETQGELEHCAEVTYDSSVCMEVQAVEPALQLKKQAPESVMLCDPITYTYVVRNTGSGTACDVTITDKLPEGMATLDQRDSVSIDAGHLGAGESREFTVRAKASKTGKYTNNALAQSESGIKAEASATTLVQQPVLKIEKTARKEQFAGRPIEYDITVSNTGDAVAENVVLQDKIPSQTTFAKASHGGTHSGGQVSWNLGSINPDKSKKVSLTVKTTGVGKARNVAMARADCADAVRATAVTDIEGVPALLLEVVDVHDPIDVGEDETYEITVTNQGFAPATNVQIVAKIDDAQEYVDAGGPTSASHEDRTVTFEPLGTLAPKSETTWTVTVRGVEARDARFGIELNADQLGRPVNETESTHMY